MPSVPGTSPPGALSCEERGRRTERCLTGILTNYRGAPGFLRGSGVFSFLRRINAADLAEHMCHFVIIVNRICQNGI